MGIQKYSKQREAILDELKSRFDHPTAEILYLSLKSKIPNLSLATVYRNLNILLSENLIKKITVDGADRFDAGMTPHYHLICAKCGKVYDVFMPQDNEIITNAQQYVHGTISSYTINFSGVCEECENK